MLDLTPDARPSEIRDAYRTALEIYRGDSLVSYSFFNEEERGKILARLERAFLTLIDKESRAQYNRELIRSGIIIEEALHRASREAPISMEALKRSRTDFKSAVSRSKKLKFKAASSQLLNKLLRQEVITGTDLQKMRDEAGISLDQIEEQTKIRTVYLEALEHGQLDRLPSEFHVKSFLRAYIRCFTTDAEPLVERYLRHRE